LDEPTTLIFDISTFWGSTFRKLRLQGVGALCIENPEVAKRDMYLEWNFGILAFRGSGSRGGSEFGIKSFKLPVRGIPKRSLFQNSVIGMTSDLGPRVSTSRYAKNLEKGRYFKIRGIGVTSDLGSRVVNSRYMESQKDVDLAKGEISVIWGIIREKE
jgi:hypothetical protein